MNRARLRGVTRFELALAASAASLLVGAALWVSRGSPGAQQDSALDTARALAGAASEWKREHGEIGCPTLSQLIVDRNWSRSERADDPWGGRFRIVCSAEEVQVRSAGSDGEFETDDDVAFDTPWNS